MLLDRKKDHSHAVTSGTWQRESQILALASEELVWDLDEDSSAVTRLGIATARTPMREVHENLNSLLDNIVTLLAADARDKSYAASIVFMCRVIQTLGGGDAIFSNETRRHGLRPTDRFPFQSTVNGVHGWAALRSHTLAQGHTFAIP